MCENFHIYPKNSGISVSFYAKIRNKINDEARCLQKLNNTFINLRKFIVDVFKFSKGSCICTRQFFVDSFKSTENILNLFVREKKIISRVI